MDLYYRAFKQFRNITKDDTSSQKLRKNITYAHRQHDVLTSVKYACTIEEDWILNIEEGLVFVEKAIREDRQFIRTEGEVVPIEKVKRVSKSSVEHLSKHSDFITRAPKNEDDIIPDKLYIVEKLNDYLVYENRFIYMLLNYLKDFVQMRIDKIKEKTTSYESHMKIHKELDVNQRHIQYKVDYSDYYENDEYLRDLYEKIPLVKRIETIYANVVGLLATPLMKEVSKAPVIKPPVVKTNVLRMNQNFKAALKLYDYVTSYMKDGYQFQEIKKTFNPFPDDLSDEISDMIQLKSVISYMVGNDFRQTFESEYNRVELEKQNHENKKKSDELKRLKKRLIEMGEDLDTYILQLEKRNAQLEKDSSELFLQKEHEKELISMMSKLEDEKILLNELNKKYVNEMQVKDEKIQIQNQKYVRDMLDSQTIHQQEIKQMIEKHQQQMIHLDQSHAQEKIDMHHRFDMEKKEIKQLHDKQVALLEEQLNALQHQEISLSENIEELKQNIKQIIDDNLVVTQQLNEKIDRLDNEKKQIHAKYLAVKVQHGLLTDQDNFTSKERFKELELEMKAYKKMFKEQWKATKIKIRADVKKEISETDHRLN